MKKYIFDVDGTLADANEPMDGQFMRWFEHWMLKKNVYLCTNNTYENILPRLGRRIVDNCVAVFTCGGNSVWVKGKEAKVVDWRPSPLLTTTVEKLINDSDFKFRSGPNFEYKTGMLSFTVAGRTASREDRNRYVMWDRQTKERNTIVETLQKKFPELYICKAGETSIDVTSGTDKSQIIQYFNVEDKIVFIGNDFSTYGNDKPLKTAVESRGGVVFKVENWNDTYKFLLNDKKRVDNSTNML